MKRKHHKNAGFYIINLRRKIIFVLLFLSALLISLISISYYSSVKASDQAKYLQNLKLPTYVIAKYEDKRYGRILGVCVSSDPCDSPESTTAILRYKNQTEPDKFVDDIEKKFAEQGITLLEKQGTIIYPKNGNPHTDYALKFTGSKEILKCSVLELTVTDNKPVLSCKAG